MTIEKFIHKKELPVTEQINGILWIYWGCRLQLQTSVVMTPFIWWGFNR